LFLLVIAFRKAEQFVDHIVVSLAQLRRSEANRRRTVADLVWPAHDPDRFAAVTDLLADRAHHLALARVVRLDDLAERVHRRARDPGSVQARYHIVLRQLPDP